MTLHEDGKQTSEMRNDEYWYHGPPYMVVEHVFDAYDLDGLYAYLDDISQ